MSKVIQYTPVPPSVADKSNTVLDLRFVMMYVLSGMITVVGIVDLRG